jgi:hypothetical protein
MSYTVIASLLCIFLSTAEDFQQITSELHRQSAEAQQQIDPLVQEAANLERQNAEARAEQDRRAEKAKELLVRTEKLKGDIKTKLSPRSLEEVLNVGTVGRCRVSLGSEPNEFHFTQEGISIRVIFANEQSPRPPFATLQTINGTEYYKIVQTDFDPANPTSTTGPMRADVRLDEQKRIVHAVFRGETIKDRGPFGFFGSSLAPRGMTCITMEAVESI